MLIALINQKAIRTSKVSELNQQQVLLNNQTRIKWQIRRGDRSKGDTVDFIYSTNACASMWILTQVNSTDWCHAIYEKTGKSAQKINLTDRKSKFAARNLKSIRISTQSSYIQRFHNIYCKLDRKQDFCRLHSTASLMIEFRQIFDKLYRVFNKRYSRTMLTDTLK